MPPPTFTGEEIRALLHAVRYQQAAASRRVLKAGAPEDFARRQRWVDQYGVLKRRLEDWLGVDEGLRGTFDD